MGESGDAAWDAPLRAPAWSLENWGAFQVSLPFRPLISLLPSGHSPAAGTGWSSCLGEPGGCPESARAVPAPPGGTACGWHTVVGGMLGEGPAPPPPRAPPPLHPHTSASPPVLSGFSAPFFHPSSQPTLPSTRGSAPSSSPAALRAGPLLILLFPQCLLSPCVPSCCPFPRCPSALLSPSAPPRASFPPCPAAASVPSLSPRWPPSRTSLSCSSAPSAWIFLTCSKHLSRKLWGRERAGPRGVASCTVQSALCQRSSCRAGSRQGLRRSADLSGSPGTPARCHSSPLPGPRHSPISFMGLWAEGSAKGLGGAVGSGFCQGPAPGAFILESPWRPGRKLPGAATNA